MTMEDQFKSSNAHLVAITVTHERHDESIKPG